MLDCLHCFRIEKFLVFLYFHEATLKNKEFACLLRQVFLIVFLLLLFYSFLSMLKRKIRLYKSIFQHLNNYKVFLLRNLQNNHTNTCYLFLSGGVMFLLGMVNLNGVFLCNLKFYLIDV